MVGFGLESGKERGKGVSGVKWEGLGNVCVGWVNVMGGKLDGTSHLTFLSAAPTFLACLSTSLRSLKTSAAELSLDEADCRFR